MVIEERLQGTAFGLVTCTYNGTLILIPTVVGYIIQLTADDAYYGFFWPGFFFLFMIFVSFLLILLLIYFDRKKFGKILNKVGYEDEGEEEIDEQIWDELYNPSIDPTIKNSGFLGRKDTDEDEDGEDEYEFFEPEQFIIVEEDEEGHTYRVST